MSRRVLIIAIPILVFILMLGLTPRSALVNVGVIFLSCVSYLNKVRAY